MLKSAFLGSIDFESENGKRFRRGLDAVLALPEDTVKALALTIPTIISLPTKRHVDSYTRDQLRKLGADRTQAAAAIDYFIAPLASALQREEHRTDTAEMLADDLHTLGFVPPSERTKILSVLSFLADEVVPQFGLEERRRATTAGVVPSFLSVGTTVELRAILNPTFKFGDNPLSHEPRIEGFVPIASILLGTDSGTPDRFCFQCSLQELSLLIDSLTAAKHELEQLARQVKLSPVDALIIEKSSS